MAQHNALHAERRTTIRLCALQLAESGGYADWQANRLSAVDTGCSKRAGCSLICICVEN